MKKGRGDITIELLENDIAYHQRKIKEHRKTIRLMKKKLNDERNIKGA